jgi:DNA-binding transcriptional ArsR family regulator
MPRSDDHVFAALAHPVRRKMLDLLQQHPGLSIADLARRFRLSGVGALKHVRILQRARLVIARPPTSGRAKPLYFNPVPIQLIYDRWTTDYSAFWSARLADVKERLESRSAHTPLQAQPKVVKSA